MPPSGMHFDGHGGEHQLSALRRRCGPTDALRGHKEGRSTVSTASRPVRRLVYASRAQSHIGSNPTGDPTGFTPSGQPVHWRRANHGAGCVPGLLLSSACARDGSRGQGVCFQTSNRRKLRCIPRRGPMDVAPGVAVFPEQGEGCRTRRSVWSRGTTSHPLVGRRCRRRCPAGTSLV